MSDSNTSPEFEEKVRKAVSVPDARPEFVTRLRYELTSRPAKKKTGLTLKPAWAVAFVLLAAMLLVSTPPVVSALRQLFGYVPEVGLVENTGNLRMLAEPVSVTRDGVTLTVKNVFVYPDRVELIYEVAGIDPSDDGSQASDYSTNPTAFCGGVNIGETAIKDGDARLLLPDGTVLEREYTSLYPQNAFAMTPVYQASIPANVTEMTMILNCIPWARRGAVPEGWSVPFELKAVPPGTVIGAPVIAVNATSVPVTTQSTVTAAPAPASASVGSAPVKLGFTLEQAVQTANGPVFYLRLHVENPDPAMKTAFPRDVYVIDSQGQKIQYMNNTPYSENPATVWEYVPTAKPAAGPLTLVLNDAVLKFTPQGDASFSFDAGDNPQYNQNWALDKEFNIIGHKVQVLSTRAATFDDIKDNPGIWDPNGGPDYPEGSQGFDNGYQFAIQYAEPGIGISLDIQSDTCGLTDVRSAAPIASVYYTQLCRDGYPKGNVRVTLNELSVVAKNIGQVTWSPEDAALPAMSAPGLAPHSVKMTFGHIVPLDSATVVYFSMNMPDRDPSLVSIMPKDVYIIDSTGQRIQLIATWPWQAFEHRPGSLFEYVSTSKPADGPLTLIVENSIAYYAPLYVEPRQATPEEMSFTFDAGADPQHDQTWEMDHAFEIAGYPFRVTSARAVVWDDVKVPEFIDGSQGYDYGYQFSIQGKPPVKMNVELDIISDKCGFTVGVPFMPENSSLLNTQLCRDEFPKGRVTVLIREISVLLENTWQATWTPPVH